MAENFVLYTDRARRALQAAEQRAEQLRHTMIRPEHLLLGLLSVPECQAVVILRRLGVDTDVLRVEVERRLPLGLGSGVAMQRAEGARRALAGVTREVLAEAAYEARDAGVNAIDTRLLLLGLLRAPALSAGDLLREHGVTLEAVRSIGPLDEAQAAPERAVKGGLPTAQARVPAGISPIFIGIIVITFAAGAGSYLIDYEDLTLSRLLLFVFVFGGWIISLCLHEFGHAVTAFLGGDRSVASKGYLTLNPIKYTNPLLSIVMPLVFMVMGGFGLPGGAVYINTAALRSRRWQSLVSAAGPAATAIFALLLVVLLAVGRGDWRAHPVFWSGTGALLFFQVTAVCLNLLPIPGLDGFGILEPFLPDAWMGAVRVIRAYSLLIFFFLFFQENAISNAFWQTLFAVNDLVNPAAWWLLQGIPFWQFGWFFFRFWIPIG